MAGTVENRQQLRMAMLREVAYHADLFYIQAQSIGAKAAKALKEGNRGRSQITGLEAIANSALKTTDVLDFIKNQAARHSEWRKDGWGVELLEYLSKDLRQKKDIICSKEKLGIDPQSIDGLEVHLQLIRTFIHQVAAHFEFTRFLTDQEAANDSDA